MKTRPHILLIDDDRLFSVIAEEMLLGAGFSVTTSQSGREALKILGEHPTDLFDLILLDRMMPEFAGLDVLYKLCYLPGIREIPVILLTGYASAKDKETAAMYGAYAVLTKPLYEPELIKTIQTALAERAQKRFPEYT